MRNTLKILAVVLISVSLTMPVAAQSANPKSASSLSQVRGKIESRNGKAVYDEEMIGSTRQDGFGTVLPNGVTAENVVRLLVPKANASLATLVGMKRWPYRKDMYVAFTCIAPSQLIKDRVIKYNNGKPMCSPEQVEFIRSDKPGEWKVAGNHLVALGVVSLDAQGHLSLASTVISWSGIDGSPLGTTWQHSNLYGPGGINHWKDEESEKLKSEQIFPSEIYKLDFAKYTLTNDNIAFGIRSGINEGYSGGGANFQVLTLFAVIDGELRAIFSEPMYYFKDIAGNWNKDGTRNHEVYEGENTVSVSDAKTNGYFRLIVKSTKKRWRKSFLWDQNLRRYLADGG